MPSKKVSLLDRAKGDLKAAKVLLNEADDVVMDICAYHCQQCVEKVVKYLILTQGDTYASDHRSDIYLEELNDANVKALVRQIGSKIDSWATTIRYHHSILSNKKMVTEVIEICEKLVAMAEQKQPRQLAGESKNCAANHFNQ
jgi:HEPN domain-containing protein